MSTNYPSQIDSNLTLPKVIDGVSPVLARDVNQLQEAILAIQTELGVEPSGIYSTLGSRMEAVAGASQVVKSSVSTTSLLPPTENVTGDMRFVTDISQFSYWSGSAWVPVPPLLGIAEDGSYSDGLFTDFTNTTPVGTAIDRINEVLSALSPPPAPALGDFSFTSSLGVSGKVSFGTSNAIGGYSNVSTEGGGSALDINGAFTSGAGTALRKGILTTGSVSGVVADSVPADTGSPNPSYPSNAFGDAGVGLLRLEVNGTIIHSVDLSSYGSGASLNGNSSGFSALSASTSILFPGGVALPVFKYRTASWIATSTDQRNGWNYARIIHDNSPTFTRSTNYFEWVVDADATATSFSGESLGALSMTGSSYLSGVEYHTGGTAQYGLTVNNLHRNTYSSGGSAVSHPAPTNCTISAAALGNISTQADSEIIAAKSVTVAPASNSRILNGSISVTTTIDRTVQSDLTSSGASITGILVDGNADTSTDTNENLNGEDYRVPSNINLTTTAGYTSGGAGLWTKTESLVGATAGYNDGILTHGGSLYYPNNASVSNSGNFSGISNGPAGNVNYTGATGSRVYLRYFFFSTTTSNFVLTMSGTGSVVNAGSVSGSSNELSVELLLPNTTQNGGATIEFKDCNIAYTSNDAIGCYASTYGANLGSLGGAAWGLTSGSRSTATSGSAAIIRVTVGQSWTGRIDNIQIVGA